MYNNYAVGGLNDWSWRYESGDWRQYPILVEPGVVGLVVEVVYSSPLTSVDLMVIDPMGYIIAGEYALYVPPYSGKIPHYTPNPMERTAKRVFVPVTQPGVYRIIIHNTILEGLKKPETVSILVWKIRATPQVFTIEQGKSSTVKLDIISAYSRMLIYTLSDVIYLTPGITITNIDRGSTIIVETLLPQPLLSNT